MPRYTATASFALSAPPAPGIPAAFMAGQEYDLPAEFAKSFPGFLTRATGAAGERAVDVTDGPAAVASADAEAAAPATRKATPKEKAPTKRAEAEPKAEPKPKKAAAKKAAAKKAPAKTKGARK